MNDYVLVVALNSPDTKRSWRTVTDINLENTQTLILHPHWLWPNPSVVSYSVTRRWFPLEGVYLYEKLEYSSLSLPQKAGGHVSICCPCYNQGLGHQEWPMQTVTNIANETSQVFSAAYKNIYLSQIIVPHIGQKVGNKRLRKTG